MKTKTVQIDFLSEGSAQVTYFEGDDQIGNEITFEKTPKRLLFFLEKFPRKGESSEESIKENLNSKP